MILIVSILALGAYLGWLQVSPRWRGFIGTKIQIVLLTILLLSMFPGPAALVKETFDWVGQKAESAVYSQTREAQWWEPSSADELVFVDKQSGDKLIWYYETENGGYRLSRSKGYDEYGEPLELADTREEMEAITAWQKKIDKDRMVAERAAAAKHDEERRMAAEESARQERIEQQERAEAETQLAKQRAEQAREAERRRLSSYVQSLPSERVDYAAYGIRENSHHWPALSSSLADQIETVTTRSASAGIFTDAFNGQGGFEKAEAGLFGDDFDRLGLATSVSQVILVRIHDESTTASHSVRGVKTYAARASVTVVDTRTGERVKDFSVGDIRGAGVTSELAESSYVERLAPRIVEMMDERN